MNKNIIRIAFVGMLMACTNFVLGESRVVAGTSVYIDPDDLFDNDNFSHVVVTECARHVHVAGQVAIRPDYRVIGKGDLKKQTREVFDNIDKALTAAGADKSQVYRIRIYIVDFEPRDSRVTGRILREYFDQENMPASTYVGVTSLINKDALIEIDADATLC